MKRMQDMTEPELSDLLNAVARSVVTQLRSRCTETPMFTVLVFNDPAIAQYVSNCEREDIIKAMRECADRLQKRQTIERN